jgi:hypothetical protein
MEDIAPLAKLSLTESTHQELDGGAQSLLEILCMQGNILLGTITLPDSHHLLQGAYVGASVLGANPTYKIRFYNNHS